MSGLPVSGDWREMYVNFETSGFVYILARSTAGTLYIGVTSDLVKRIGEHREGSTGGFAAKYKRRRLVYFEELGSIEAAINREKQLKSRHRLWKIQLIEKDNPNWSDLYPNLLR